MAEGGEDDIGTMPLAGLLDNLLAMTLPVPNDKRQDQYCGYINTFVSAYGKEYCMVVGSTKEGTRLRSKQDEGDYDYILLCNFTVPVDCLEYREDLPCFVHIKGSFMGQDFCDQLIDGVYLPTWLLRDVSTLAFPRLKGILDIVSRSSTSHGRHTPHLAISTDMRLGYNLTNFADWDCKDLNVKQNVRTASERALRQQFDERRKGSKALTEDPNNILPSFAAVVDFVQNRRSNDTSSSLIYQQLGPMLSALAGRMSGTSNKRPTDEYSGDKQEETVNNFPDSDTSKKAKIQPIDKKESMAEGEIKNICHSDTEHMDVSTKQTDRESVIAGDNTSSIQINKEELMETTTEEAKHQEVYATYSSKSEKDFIPAARLSGPPKFIEDWKQRALQEHWPRSQVVEVISRSQFFVVAKPAVKDEKAEIDFSLSCNMAEIMLTKEMPPGHMKCLLMVKAFQRSILEEYSKVLTTFHWKTALYWMLESTDPSTYSEKSDDILDVLRNLLDYMRDRLHEGRLLHYFFPSNLFAGLERDVCVEIVKKIDEIHLDPEFYLRSFFCLEKERVHNRRVVKIPAETLTKVKNDVVHKRDELTVDAFANALEGFAKPPYPDSAQQPKVPVQNLLFQIAETAATDEENRRKEEEAKDPRKAVTPSVSKDSLMDSVKDLVSKLGADKKTRREAEKEAEKKALAFFFAGKK
ncbi:uncharacterized protein LOC117334717 [Pecten maximus]|uniref:uncharacterized protein LOC117334717 n=1 Tax=Pecten maximus TaxID=6579 RepID=UPI0014584263|nr:uncharacterized protein LOC117334717 [Pecten maximus]